MSALVANAGWMGWNAFLALIPLVLSRFLFGHRERPRWLLITGGAVFVAFLPNAPYVLTDVLHLPRDLHYVDGWVAAGLLAQYLTLFAIGFAAYVLSLVRLERWLADRGVSRRAVLFTDLSLHALCAVGIVLGRVFRFNSWDLVTNPGGLLDLVRVPQPRTVVVLFVLFAMLAGGAALARALPAIMDRAVRLG
ncbi:DUF1361 domain-containing protein [Actinophytocola algeriensis]|jgi:uncharacterized membrane protein|uniref:Putative membrane protein n=1 Tax=Actinophytocola algeriensis TaxID=1768010 RepID=A0A7W7VBW6_9PSEU|nr:DUF1361 domain-containing protein [Actinophytocola algeriensis]MBB4904469.1 putative membrane protein [Actinophytocola algeriensis]MBE1476672.1 putative membrane protein [Actinophytocola algeriensis]